MYKYIHLYIIYAFMHHVHNIPTVECVVNNICLTCSDWIHLLFLEMSTGLEQGRVSVRVRACVSACVCYFIL